jgi:hypothetical protein
VAVIMPVTKARAVREAGAVRPSARERLLAAANELFYNARYYGAAVIALAALALVGLLKNHARGDN